MPEFGAYYQVPKIHEGENEQLEVAVHIGARDIDRKRNGVLQETQETGC